MERKDKQIELLLGRLRRQKQDAVAVHVPPIPISMSALIPSADGLLGTAFLPVSGQITLVAIHIDSIVIRDENYVPSITIRLVNDQYDISRTYKVKSGYNRFEEELFIPEGSKLYVVANEPGNLRGVWFAAMYQIEIKAAAYNQIAVDALESTVFTE